MKKNIEKIVKHAEVSEKSIEKYLVKRVEELGGKCIKYNNPGLVGYPDRICLFNGGLTIWVELKSKGGQIKPIQRVRINSLQIAGHNVHVCDSKEAIDEMLQQYKFD